MSDESDGIELTRRKLLGGVATVGAAGATAGVGTMAAWQETVESEDNYVEAGTLDLKISDNDESYGDSVTETFTLDNAKPGDDVSNNFSLKNVGSIEADHVELGFSYEEIVGDETGGSTMPDSADGMAKQIEVSDLTYNGENLLEDRDFVDANGNGRIDLDDLTASENADNLDNLRPPPPAGGGTESLFATFLFADDPDNNDYQGDRVEFTISAALHQLEGQDIND